MGSFEQLMPHEQRGAQRAAGVTCRRLNPQAFERTLALEPAVGDAVDWGLT